MCYSHYIIFYTIIFKKNYNKNKRLLRETEKTPAINRSLECGRQIFSEIKNDFH